MNVKNVDCFHLESMTQLEKHTVKHPILPHELPGHVFLKQQLPIKGSEIGIHCLEAYESMPFYHKHNKHEETYIFYSGEGEFKVDDEIIPIKEGSIIHVKPNGIRTWRNTSQTALYWICVQSSVEHEIPGNVQDGTALKKEVIWS